MDEWVKKGATVGVLIGVIGTAITWITGSISTISYVPYVLLPFGMGLAFEFIFYEFLLTTIFYGLLGLIIGHLYGVFRKITAKKMS